MIVLTVDEIVLLHGKLLLATDGTPGLRDPGLLESAVLGVNAGFGDSERYPTVEAKAARLAFALVNNHAFVDGNKRVGMLHAAGAERCDTALHAERADKIGP